MINLATVLRLTRPLAIIDTETTGLTDSDRIVQLAITLHYPSADPVRYLAYVNPEMPIPEEAQNVHGISDVLVKDHLPFIRIAPIVKVMLFNCDLAGHNVHFDLKKIRSEFKRVGVEWDWEQTDALVIDTKRIAYNMTSLEVLYEAATGKKLKDAHDAGKDVEATETVLEWQVRVHHLPTDITALEAFCWPTRPDYVDRAGKFVWRAGEACVGFGKYNGTPVSKLKKDYLQWMLRGDFPLDAKAIARNALNRVYPRRNSDVQMDQTVAVSEPNVERVDEGIPQGEAGVRGSSLDTVADQEDSQRSEPVQHSDTQAEGEVK